MMFSLQKRWMLHTSKHKVTQLKRNTGNYLILIRYLQRQNFSVRIPDYFFEAQIIFGSVILPLKVLPPKKVK